MERDEEDRRRQRKKLYKVHILNTTCQHTVMYRYDSDLTTQFLLSLCQAQERRSRVEEAEWGAVGGPPQRTRKEHSCTPPS